ncbi:hypothetical protein [Streptomyces sp. CB02130]|uniref:hypothetical protein n=1 Tax=Streptomyces sp. CB02130 TaxID=1703934 RepID=UPI000ACE9C61|nr:hypothetical protein [Streptomyces sp. CB02130]
MVEGLGPRGTGKRLDRDIETYKSVWRGETPAGCDNPLVPKGSREVPLAGADTAGVIASAVSGGTEEIKKTVSEFEAIGADELILNPTSDDVDEILRVADVVL